MPQVNEISWFYNSIFLIVSFLVLVSSMNFFLFKEKTYKSMVDINFFLLFY